MTERNIQFKVTQNYCLLNGNVMEGYDDSPTKTYTIDKSLVSKIEKISGLPFVQKCNEYEMGKILGKYPHFLVAKQCRVIQRTLNPEVEKLAKRNLVEDENTWVYDNERDKLLFETCSASILNLNNGKPDWRGARYYPREIEVYVYDKNDNDLQYYMDNPVELRKLLTKNGSLSLVEGINQLIIYFINVIAILYHENVIHKDIKPGNIVVGNDFENFPNNIKIIDLGITFQYQSLSIYVLEQLLNISHDPEGLLASIKSEYGNQSKKKLADLVMKHVMIEHRDDESRKSEELWTKKYSEFLPKGITYMQLYALLNGISTPEYTSPEFTYREKVWYGPNAYGGESGIALAVSTLPTAQSLEYQINRYVLSYIYENQTKINYMRLLQLFSNNIDGKDKNDPTILAKEIDFDITENNVLKDEKILTSILDYNTAHNTKYGIYELLYLMVNGLMGRSPLLYKYDIYSFGLILKKMTTLLNLQQETGQLKKQLKKQKKRTTRKKKQKKRTKKKKLTGGATSETKTVVKKGKAKVWSPTTLPTTVEETMFIIEHLCLPDVIYRWSLKDIFDYYRTKRTTNKKQIRLGRMVHTLCGYPEPVTLDILIGQLLVGNPEFKMPVKKKPKKTMNPRTMTVGSTTIRTRKKKT